MTLVDTHTHLYLEQFDNDRSAVVQKALESGVKKMLLPNIDSESLSAMKSMHAAYPDHCLPMMGLHPTSVKEDFEKELAAVEREFSSGTYVAVGEIGMDLYWDKTFQAEQEEAFRKQLQLAKKLRLPVSIHTRDAFDEIYKIFKEEKTDDLKGVFHCFTGTIDQARKIMELDSMMGIGGVITFRNSKLGEVIARVPLEYLVLETDAPFLAPMPFRGKRNESSYLTYIAEKLAAVKQVPLQEVAEKTSKNAERVFHLQSN